MSIMDKSIKELNDWAESSGHEIRLLMSPKRMVTGTSGFTGKRICKVYGDDDGC